MIFGLALFDVINNKLMDKFKNKTSPDSIKMSITILIPLVSAFYNNWIVKSVWSSVIVFILCIVLLAFFFIFLARSAPDSQSGRYTNGGSLNSTPKEGKNLIVSYFILLIAFLGVVWLPVSAYIDDQPPIITSFTYEPTGLQIYGQPVLFIAEAEDANDDQLYYSFYVDDEKKCNWSKCNYWMWDTSKANASSLDGKYRIKVEVKDGNGLFGDTMDDFRELDYKLASVNIEYPKYNDTVNEMQIVNGTSKGIGSDRNDMLWIFVKTSRTCYHPQDKGDLQIDENGNWSTEIYLSGNTGEYKEIIAAILNDSALNEIVEYYKEGKKEGGNWPGLDRLPIGAKEVDYVWVIRD